jgi:hypothetical protein
VAESPITIEYTLVALEEIRRLVAEGLQQLSRGGLEVGGTLYGSREGRTVRVLALREIGCEHAHGPAFLLSDRDRAGLDQHLAQDREDARLEGMICVGWFVSHTRGEIALTDSDQEIYASFFPAPWQVTLVIRPGRASAMRAGFFVREADGSVKAGQSYMDFSFPDRLAGVMASVHQRRERGSPATRRDPGFPRLETVSGPAAPVRREPSRAAELPAATPRTRPLPAPVHGRGRRWGWLTALLLAIVAALWILRFLALRPGWEPFALSVSERDGQLQIEWNQAARPVARAARGSLQITDGQDIRTVPLNPQELAAGRFSYVRNTGDVNVRMSVEDQGGGRVEEASRFLGPAPAKVEAADVDAVLERRDELEAEVSRLREQNDQQAERIQELERTLRILQTRLSAGQEKKVN